MLRGDGRVRMLFASRPLPGLENTLYLSEHDFELPVGYSGGGTEMLEKIDGEWRALNIVNWWMM